MSLLLHNFFSGGNVTILVDAAQLNWSAPNILVTNISNAVFTVDPVTLNWVVRDPSINLDMSVLVSPAVISWNLKTVTIITEGGTVTVIYQGKMHLSIGIGL